MLRTILTTALLALAPLACSNAEKTSAPPAPMAVTATSEPWSLRNARVAIPRNERPATLTYFVRELGPDDLARARAAAPHVTFVVGLSREEALTRAAEAHGADVFYATPEFLAAATNLRWVQAWSAGVDRFVVVDGMNDDRIVLTNMRGVHGPAIADHVMALTLALTRSLPASWDAQKRGVWDRGDVSPPRVALDGKTLLVVGLGGIGTEIAKRGHAFGMRVVATRRSAGPATDPSMPCVERIGRPQDLPALVAEADVIAVAVPLTAETTGLFNADLLARCKSGAILINIARGKVIDTDALMAALRSGRLGAAGLDVTDPEPLPDGHPLWTVPNVVITPHVAGDAAITDRRATEVFVENARRFDAGEPLVNVVDKRAGY
ncbi:MAG: D-2-hydroxyacid dehydrogenase [Phycisphaerae bacterium]|nr:D-2-hydroxyacid dehydrogenase [Phycisphaerae bacterium]